MDKEEKARQIGVEEGRIQYSPRNEGVLCVDLWARGNCDQC